MSARSSGRVGFRRDTDDHEATKFEKQNSVKRADGRRTRLAGTCRFRLPKRSELSPATYIKHLGDKILRLLLCGRGKRAPPLDVSSSGRAKPLVAALDSRRAEAINDCIDFINSSSSLQRSNSVSC